MALVKNEKNADSIGEILKTIFYAVLIAFGVRTFAYEPFNIPTGSMIPSLLVGDFLFVSKYTYGYSKYTIAFGLPLFDGRILGKMPERGDVAVFRVPGEGQTENFIKRIIGLPGDTIQVTGGILQINGKPVQRERIEDYVDKDDFGRESRVPQYIETLPNGVKHRIMEIYEDHGPLDNTPLYKVPEGHLFMMGDSRDNSQDSRVLDKVGYVPIENVVGRAEFLFFSLDNKTSFYKIWRWPVDLRFSRLFKGIH